MPRRSILSAAERESLLALPDNRDDLIRRYTLSESDLSIIRQRRGAANRLGFAVQLCYLRFPALSLESGNSRPLLSFILLPTNSGSLSMHGQIMAVVPRLGGSTWENFKLSLALNRSRRIIIGSRSMN